MADVGLTSSDVGLTSLALFGLDFSVPADFRGLPRGLWGVSGRLVDPSSCELIKGLLSVDVEHFGSAGVLCSTI